ncbi:MAG TPA: cation diffusion facilitator family transporter [Bauldia sp.]|nr:cation diffusion facilitator family transporter [Bauldia sp.]
MRTLGTRTGTNTLAATGVAVGVLVLALKFAAWYLTGSVALWSDALESVVNVATAIATLAAVYYGALPADANHPYGHGKAEYFSVVLEGVLIVIASISIIRAAYEGFIAPRVLDQPALGLAVTVLASLINAGWGWILVREGRRRNSPALTADGIHLFTDVATSAGVIVGLLLALATGYFRLDSILAAAVALNILWAGWRVIRMSIGGLMDEAVAPATLDRIRTLISANADGAIEAHDLRTRQAGHATFIEFHLVVPGTMPVSQSHDICDQIERALKAEVANATITIHVEPEEKAKHTGVVVV